MSRFYCWKWDGDGNISSCGIIYFYVLSRWYFDIYNTGLVFQVHSYWRKKECKYNRSFWFVGQTGLANHHGPPELEAQTRNYMTGGQEHVLGEFEPSTGPSLKLTSSTLKVTVKPLKSQRLIKHWSLENRNDHLHYDYHVITCSALKLMLSNHSCFFKNIFYIANNTVIENLNICVISKSKHA